MAKVVNLNGMTIRVIDAQEKDAFLTQDDKDNQRPRFYGTI